MKQGQTLINMSTELLRQRKLKKDYLVNTRHMLMAQSGESIDLLGLDQTPTHHLKISDLAHRQLGQKLGIPAKYYEVLRQEKPQLLAKNVNSWLYSQNEQRMVRTLDFTLRAYLSKRYRPMDNADLAEATLPIITNAGYKIHSCNISDHKFYIKAVTDRIYDEIEKNDIVQSGICISNSEVGLGGLKVVPLVYRLACLNGMIMNDFGVRKHHVGRKHVECNDVSEFYTDETRKADDKALWLKVRDTVRATLDEVHFRTIVNSLKTASQRQITGTPLEVIKHVSSRFAINENEQASVLSHLVTGGSLTQYALANAVTRTAQDVESYDRSTELEGVGANIVTLDQTDWSVINAA